MGQKINPIKFRIQHTKDWRSRWFASNRKFATSLNQDIQTRNLIEKRFEGQAVIDRINIDRSHKMVSVTIFTSKPGMVIGKGGIIVEEIKAELAKIFKTATLRINIEEIKRPELFAKLVGESIGRQLKARGSFRRAMNSSADATMRAGAKGVRIQVSGRIGGGEMSRRETVSKGSVPLHTIRANIDYALTEVKTPAGILGIKIWINKGES
ncbi:30S ribosomal protein S3 [Candidatus Saccharibacteria bacterium]|jgi:small subunit ribosomal protein S3|nr:30S ribosomal protein S3 [Candidatus Saccharibacteria bacterium]